MSFSPSREPAVWAGAVASLLALGADFGLHLSTTAYGHILDAIPAVAAVLIRSQVSPAGAPIDQLVQRAQADQATFIQAQASLEATAAAVARVAGLVTPAPAPAPPPQVIYLAQPPAASPPAGTVPLTVTHLQPLNESTAQRTVTNMEFPTAGAAPV